MSEVINPSGKNNFIPSWDVWRKGVDAQLWERDLDATYPPYAHQVTLGSDVRGDAVAFTFFDTGYNPYKLKDMGWLVEQLSAGNLPWVCQGLTPVTVSVEGVDTTTWYQVSGILRINGMAANTFDITYIDPTSGLQTKSFVANQCVDRITKLWRI